MKLGALKYGSVARFENLVKYKLCVSLIIRNDVNVLDGQSSIRSGSFGQADVQFLQGPLRTHTDGLTPQYSPIKRSLGGIPSAFWCFVKNGTNDLPSDLACQLNLILF